MKNPRPRTCGRFHYLSERSACARCSQSQRPFSTSITSSATARAFTRPPVSTALKALSASGSTRPPCRTIAGVVQGAMHQRGRICRRRLSKPQGSRPYLGSLLLAYYTAEGELVYAGRAGTGMDDKTLKRLHGILKPLQIPKMALSKPPPRGGRFGSPLKPSEVTWVRPVRGASALSHLDDGRTDAAGRVSRAAGRQGGARGGEAPPVA
jgi:hypothetical protein